MEGPVGETLKATLDPKKFPERVLSKFMKSAADEGMDKAIEKLTAGAESEEDKSALVAPKTALHLVKGTAKPAKKEEEHKKDPAPAAPPPTEIKPDKIIMVN